VADEVKNTSEENNNEEKKEEKKEDIKEDKKEDKKEEKKEDKKEKKKAKKKDDGADNVSDEEKQISDDIRNTLELRRTAKETKRYKVLIRIFGLIMLLLIMIVAAAYAISYFYTKFGCFTVSVDKYDMVQQGLTLSETPDYKESQAVLNADIVYDMTNISGEDIPASVDQVNGPHNGDSYMAYTFYLINSGDDTISYEGDLHIDDVTKNVDEAIRVAVYTNGKKVVYGKTKSNGTGKEGDCDSTFLSSVKVMQTKRDKFKPKEKDKYTVVIWLEGNDPDCVDAIVGGTIKFGMKFRIVEST